MAKFTTALAIELEPLFSRAHPIFRDANSLAGQTGASHESISFTNRDYSGGIARPRLSGQPAAAHKQSRHHDVECRCGRFEDGNAQTVGGACHLDPQLHRQVLWRVSTAPVPWPSVCSKSRRDIGAAIIPYYGEAAGKKLAQLLRDHILIAADVAAAAKAGNGEQLASAQQKWQLNGDEIAASLSGANPHWGKEETRSMLRQHLTFTTNEVVARLKKDWAADIKAYDDGHVHMLMFADTLAVMVSPGSSRPNSSVGSRLPNRTEVIFRLPVPGCTLPPRWSRGRDSADPASRSSEAAGARYPQARGFRPKEASNARACKATAAPASASWMGRTCRYRRCDYP